MLWQPLHLGSVWVWLENILKTTHVVLTITFTWASFHSFSEWHTDLLQYTGDQCGSSWQFIQAAPKRQTNTGLYETRVTRENVRSAHWYDLHHNNTQRSAQLLREWGPHHLIPPRPRAHALKFLPSLANQDRQNNWPRMQMCKLPCSEARRKNMMCLEWQVEVSHSAATGHNDISVWQSYTTRGGRRNVSGQSGVRMAFGVRCHTSASLLWFSILHWQPRHQFNDVNQCQALSSPCLSSPFLNPPPHLHTWEHVVRVCVGTRASTCSQRHTVLNNKAKDMCPLGGEIAHYLWATFHLHSWLLWEPLWLWWKSHKPLLGDSTGLSADTLMDSFVIGREGNDSVWASSGFVWWSMEKHILDLTNETGLVVCVNPTAEIPWARRRRAHTHTHTHHLVSSGDSTPWGLLIFAFDGNVEL